MHPTIRHLAERALRSTGRAVPLAAAADLLGAHRSADRLRRVSGEDLASVDVVTSNDGHRVRVRVRVRMQRHGGADQIARQVGDGGLWGFEPPLPALFIELARASIGTVVDVGANTGLYSLLAAAANPALHVHAVEPLPAVHALLDANLSLNPQLRHRIHPHVVALSDRIGRAMLYLPAPCGGIVETSASLDPAFKEDVTSALAVDTRTLDDLWLAIGTPQVGIVKVDTEGTEHLVLRGAARVLTQCRPVVICEVLPRAAFSELTEWLAASGYLDVRLRTDGLVVGTRVGFDPDGWNHAFVPQGVLGTFEAAARAVGVAVVAE